MVIRLVNATENDLPLMLAWRSNKLVYNGFYTQNSPLSWEEHLKWWQSRPSSWRSFIILYENRPVGVITVGQLEHWSPELGFYIGEVSLWGEGIGKEAVKLGCEWLKDNNYLHVHTTVLTENERSTELLKSLGFQYMAEAREGEIWMERKL